MDQFGFDVVTCCGYLPQVSGAELTSVSHGETLSYKTKANKDVSLEPPRRKVTVRTYLNWVSLWAYR